MNEQQAIRDEHRAQQQENAPTDFEPYRKDTFGAVSDSIVSEEQQSNFEHGPVANLTSDQIPVRDVITSIPFYVEDLTTKLVFETVTA